MRACAEMRRGGVLAITSVLLTAIAASSAGAATQLGQVAPSGSGIACSSGGWNVVQVSVSSGTPYEVPPPGGVITAWQHRGGSPNSGSGRLQVWTPVADPTFTLRGRSEIETFTSGVVSTFQTQIPVQAGDVLGLRVEDETSLCSYFPVTAGLQRFQGPAQTDPIVGDTRTFVGTDSRHLNISATLEPDADNDGFGDETQDACPADPALQEAPCDRVAPNTTITKGPKAKTKKKQATFEFSGTDTRAIASFQCSLDGAAFSTCTSPFTVKVKKGKHTFSVRATDQAGNVGPPATHDWKVKKKKKKR